MKKITELYKVDKNGCWRFKLYISSNGYGKLMVNRKSVQAHRFFYEKFKGKIKNGLCVDHLCRVRDCVNPSHLEAVTLKENILRGVGASAVNYRKKSCRKGHTYNKKYKNMMRICSICKLEYDNKYYKKQMKISPEFIAMRRLHWRNAAKKMYYKKRGIQLDEVNREGN